MNFIKRALAVFSGNIAFALSSLVVASILISTEGLEEYGLFVMLQACFQAWNIISKPLTWQAIVKYQDEYDLAVLIGMSLKLEAAAILITAPVLFAIKYGIDLIIPEWEAYGSSVVAIGVTAIIYGNGTLVGWLRAKRKFYVYSFVQYWMAISRVILSLFFHSDVVCLFILSLVADSFGWLCCWVYISKSEKIAISTGRLSFGLDLFLGKFAKYSYWGTLHGVLDLPLTQLDRLIISAVSGLEVAGVINLIRRISGTLNQIADPIYQVSLPEFSTLVHGGKYLKLRQVCTQISAKLLAVGVVLIILAFITFPFVNEYIFNGKLIGYRGALMMALAVQTMVLVFVWVHPLFIIFGFMKETASIIIVSNIIYVIACYALVSKFEVLGGVAALFLQYVIVITYKVVVLKKSSSIFN